MCSGKQFLSPAVSVILPTFNRVQYLRQAVESVLSQTFTDWELIIADDGSGAETTAYLETLRAHERVRLLKLPHTGNPSKVRNAALREARGEYVAFIDSDDTWLPNKLEVQLDALRVSQRRWSYSALTRVNHRGEVMPGERAGRRPTPSGSILRELLTLEVVIATPAVMVERALLNETGGFDEEQLFFEEYDLWLRLNLCSEVCAVPAPLAQVRCHEQHYSADRVGVYHARFRLLDKFARLAADARLESVILAEKAKTAAALAGVLASQGRRAEALQMLWRSRGCASQARWWRHAATTAARAIAPAWIRNFVRNIYTASGARPARQP